MLNNLTLMGRLTADPELRTTTTGKSVASFTLAVDRNYNPSGEKKTDFFNCVAWGNTADFVTRYFTKGKLMAVRAEMQSRSYENSEGRKVTVWEAIVQEVHFCGDRSESRPASPNVPYENVEEIEDDEDLPF